MSEYLTAIEALRRRFKVVASTEDWLGLPIQIFKAGGQEGPPALVTAGATGVEVATVYAALELLVQVDVERTTYILPSRDPTALHDASYILSRILGESVAVGSAVDAMCILRERAEVVVDDSELFLALVKGVGVAIGKRTDAFETLSIIEQRLGRGELLDSLEGVRVLVASQLPQVEGIGEVGRFVTAYIEGGRVFTYDDIGQADIPEVAFLRDFLRREEVGLVVDLHEARGPAFLALTSEPPSSVERTILYLVIDQIKRSGVPVATLEQIEGMGLSPSEEGIAYGRGVCGLVDFASETSYALALLAPIHSPLDARTRTLSLAALSALNAYVIASI